MLYLISSCLCRPKTHTPWLGLHTAATLRCCHHQLNKLNLFWGANKRELCFKLIWNVVLWFHKMKLTLAIPFSTQIQKDQWHLTCVCVCNNKFYVYCVLDKTSTVIDIQFYFWSKCKSHIHNLMFSLQDSMTHSPNRQHLFCLLSSLPRYSIRFWPESKSHKLS